MMIVITVGFSTNGDYTVNDEKAGTVSADGYDHCGTFLCADVKEAEAVIMRLSESVSRWFGKKWFERTFAEAIRALRKEPDALRLGWSEFLEGNYTGTFIFMQTIPGEYVRPIRCRECVHHAWNAEYNSLMCNKFDTGNNTFLVPDSFYCGEGKMEA